MVHRFDNSEAKMKTKAGITALLVLGGCGGGGGGGDDVVSGFDRSGQEVRVCIDGIDPPDPSSVAGQDTTASLMEYYDLTGPAQVFTSFELSCTQLDPTVDEVVTVEEYNAVIVPSTGTKKPDRQAVRKPSTQEAK